MSTAYVDSRDIRIAENKKRREKIVRRQWAILITAVVIAAIAFTILFINLSMVLHAQSEPAHFKYYTSITVSAGETLTDIADRYYSDEFKSIEAYISEVRSINHIDDNDKLYAGTDIIVPYYSEIFK